MKELKDLAFYCKVERSKKNINTHIQIKPLVTVPTLNKFLKHAKKLLM